MKPKKIIYEDQQEVWREAEKFLQSIVKDKPAVKKAIVWASLAEGKFGLYEEEYQGMEGSDIDLVLIMDEEEIVPEEWAYTGVSKSWFDLYTKLGKFKYKGHIHKVDGLLVFPSRHDMQKMEASLAGRSRIVYERK